MNKHDLKKDESWPKFLFKLKLIEKKRSEVKQLKLAFLCVNFTCFIVILIYLYQLFGTLNPNVIAHGILSSKRLKETSSENLMKVAGKTKNVLYKEWRQQIIHDKHFFNQFLSEFDAFFEIARYDLFKHLPFFYSRLINSQKKEILKTFPEFANQKKVEMAIDNIVDIGGPKLYEAFISYLHEHKKTLYRIFEIIEILKERYPIEIKDSEKAALGITLEIFGHELRKEGEKAGD